MFSFGASARAAVALGASMLIGPLLLVGSPTPAGAATRLSMKVPANPQTGRALVISVTGLSSGSTAQLFGPTSLLAEGAAPSGFTNFRVTFGQPGVIKLRAVELVKGKAARQVTVTVRVRGTAVAAAPAVSGSAVEAVSSGPVSVSTEAAGAVPTTKAGVAVAKTTVPACGAIRLWPLGDSLTVGGYGDGTGFTDSYRYELFRLLRAGGSSRVVFRGHIGKPGSPQQWGAILPAGVTDEFSHSGLGGATVTDIFKQIDTLAAAAKPDLVVLNIGTNGGTPDEYRQLVARIQQLAPNAAIVMGTLTPGRTELDAKATTGFRLALNDAIRALGNASAADKLFVAEVFERMLTDHAMNRSDFSDDTHLSISGGSKFAKALLPEVTAAIAQTKRNC
jgi:lysophospholipase L1-like esterase